MFDLNMFYQELFLSLGTVVVDEEAQLEFMATLVKQGDLDFALLTQRSRPGPGQVVSQLRPAHVKSAERLFQLRLLQIVEKLLADARAQAPAAPPNAAALANFKQTLAQRVSSLLQKDVLGLVALIKSKDLDGSVLEDLRSNDPPFVAALKTSSST